MLTARAHEDGRAHRTASLLHRRLLERPLQIVAWEYGVEPFTVGAIGYGVGDAAELSVPGFPINRDLLFMALESFAADFNRYFDMPYDDCDEIERGARIVLRSRTIPQIVVPNSETVALLGRLGRRLAYLRVDGDRPANPQLIRLGRHLMFVARRSQFSGQQLVVPATELLAAHWQSGMSGYEAMSLAALDAWIEPPQGIHAFEAAAEAERRPVGPRPDGRDGSEADRLVEAFNEARARSTDRDVVGPMLGDLRRHYGALVERTWHLTRRCIDRVRAWPEAPSVERRFEADRDAYSEHMAWMNGPAEGRRRARPTARQAAMELDRLEAADSGTAAEEAVDDPVRLVPLIVSGKAIAGRVRSVDAEHRVQVGAQRRRRPIVVLDCEEPCVMPLGKELWWTGEPAGREYVICNVESAGQGSRVTLELQTDRSKALPAPGERASFSHFRLGAGYQRYLPEQPPWPLRSASEPRPTDLEASADEVAA